MEIRNEFVKRISEINSFYEILRIIEFEKPKIFGFNIDENKIENLIIDNNKIDTLRSTSYLLLYNLIESTIYNSIITIFDDINDKGLKYFDIIEEVQNIGSIIFTNMMTKTKETIIDTIMNIAKPNIQ